MSLSDVFDFASSMADRFSDLTERNKELESKLFETESALEDAEDRIHELEKRMPPVGSSWLENYSTLKAKCEKLEEDSKSFDWKMEKIKGFLEGARSARDRAENRASSIESDLKYCREANEALIREKAEAWVKVAELEIELSTLRNDEPILRDRMIKAEQRLSFTQEELAKVKSNNTYKDGLNASLQFELAEKEQVIKGLRGELGTMKHQLNVALKELMERPIVTHRCAKGVDMDNYAILKRRHKEAIDRVIGQGFKITELKNRNASQFEAIKGLEEELDVLRGQVAHFEKMQERLQKKVGAK